MTHPRPIRLIPFVLALLVLGGCGGAGYATYGAEVGIGGPIVEEPC